MAIFLSKVLFRKYTAMFKVLSQHLRGTLKTAFERHTAIEDFMDMDEHWGTLMEIRTALDLF